MYFSGAFSLVSRAIKEMEKETRQNRRGTLDNTCYVRSSHAIAEHYHREYMRACDLLDELTNDKMNDGCIAAPMSSEDYQVLAELVISQIKKW